MLRVCPDTLGRGLQSFLSMSRIEARCRSPRGDLRRSIAARDAAVAHADRQREAIQRAKDLVRTAERRVSEAAEALENTRGAAAEEIAAAAQAGSTPKANGALRSARAALSDATDEAEAAKAALDRLEEGGDDLKASSPQLENAVLVAISQVVAPVAERLLEEIRRKQSDLLILQQVFEGDATAQKRLGDMYEQGQSVPQDYALAVLWYRRAADQGFKLAQWLLGTYYQTGYGVQQDYVQAHMWYNLSATQGWGPAAVSRTILEKAMTPAQVAEAQKLAREWKPKPER